MKKGGAGTASHSIKSGPREASTSVRRKKVKGICERARSTPFSRLVIIIGSRKL